MLNQRLEAARPIAKKINEVEKSLNLTMVQMGELMSSIAAARMAPGTRFSLTAGVDASEKVLEAATQATQCYREIVEAHSHLAADRDEAGLETVGMGDLIPCPPAQASRETEEKFELRAVETA